MAGVCIGLATLCRAYAPQFRSVGTITFDGHGHGSRTGTIWYGGSPMFIAPGDTNPIGYSVNSDCTFIYTCTLQAAKSFRA